MIIGFNAASFAPRANQLGFKGETEEKTDFDPKTGIERQVYAEGHTTTHFTNGVSVNNNYVTDSTVIHLPDQSQITYNSHGRIHVFANNKDLVRVRQSINK